MRAARALLNWSRADLAAKSGVAERTIVRIELSEVTPYERTLRDLCRALESAGIEFHQEPGAFGVKRRL